MAEPAAKRPKVEKRGDDGYVPGNIIEIELRNFMTYDHLVCRPAPRLNLVIGPNGSGKSSLVCAIAIGLAGEPQLLGRASSVGAYVKRGEDSGFVRITLRGDSSEELINVTRKIDTRNKSEWSVNGKAVAKRDVIEVIKKFNIQVNNLTQFLPQDRVCEFAKLTPVQLLEETEKAVGNPELPFQHRALVEKSVELKKLEVTVKQNGDTLNQLKALSAEQEKDVERVRQREQLLEKVESMKRKLPWLRYDMKKMEYIEAKERENVAKENLDEAARVLNDLKNPIELKKQEKAIEDTIYKKLRNLINQNAKKRMDVLENENRLGVQLRGKYSEVDDLRRQEESRQQRLAKAKEDLSIAEMDLASMSQIKHPKDVTDKLASQITELELAAKEKRRQKSDQERLLLQKKASLNQCADRLKDMENANNKRLGALRNSGTEKIFEAYEWMQRHKHELRREVYGPVIIEVNVPNRVHASYLEDHVPYYIWKSVITLDSADRDFLVKSLGSYDVPVLNYVADRNSNQEPFNISNEMQRLGIYSRLDQVFDAPHAVKEVLISQAGLDRSYIGSAEAEHKADEIPRLGVQDLWTPENHYRWSRSRYGGHVSALVEEVSPSRLFTTSLDATEVEKLRTKTKEFEEAIAYIEQSCKSLQIEIRNLENEAADLHKEREDKLAAVQLEMKKRREMENRVCQRRRKFESIAKEDDVDAITKRLMDQSAKLNRERFELAMEIKKLLVEAVSLKWSFAEKYFSTIEFENMIREMEMNTKQQEKVALQASEKLEYCKNETVCCRKELHTLKIKAEAIATITPELEEAFLQMPTTIEELEAAIEDHLSQANSILFLNQNILEEYESRQRRIDSMQNKLETDEKDLKRCLSEVHNLKEKWLPTLRSLVGQINETFSLNFREMAVAGEVSLDEHDMDFDKYGILIKVKFRETGELQVLSAHHQSGGERSVSTILYLVSLQDLTNCPFRVVDEINQGMDPINERNMFQQLVRAASQPNTPQCFLLTPKLLPGLEYSDACTVLNIVNGPYIPEASKAWSGGKTWAEAMGLVS